MRARNPVLFGRVLSAPCFSASRRCLPWWPDRGWLSAAKGVDDKSKADIEARSLLGSYLAGRVARGQHDTEAAATYYRQALVRDPGNDVLIEQSFLMELIEGNWPRTEQLARDLAELQPPRRMAHAFMGLVDFKAKRYAEADEHFKSASANPIGELTSTLARAWLYQAQDKTQEALALLEAPKQPDWAQYYLRFHRALLADQAGRRAEARAAYRAHSQERPAHAARHAGLRAPRRQRRRLPSWR